MWPHNSSGLPVWHVHTWQVQCLAQQQPPHMTLGHLFCGLVAWAGQHRLIDSIAHNWVVNLEITVANHSHLFMCPAMLRALRHFALALCRWYLLFTTLL